MVCKIVKTNDAKKMLRKGVLQILGKDYKFKSHSYSNGTYTIYHKQQAFSREKNIGSFKVQSKYDSYKLNSAEYDYYGYIYTDNVGLIEAFQTIAEKLDNLEFTIYDERI